MRVQVLERPYPLPGGEIHRAESRFARRRAHIASHPSRYHGSGVVSIPSGRALTFQLGTRPGERSGHLVEGQSGITGVEQQQPTFHDGRGRPAVHWAWGCRNRPLSDFLQSTFPFEVRRHSDSSFLAEAIHPVAVDAGCRHRLPDAVEDRCQSRLPLAASRQWNVHFPFTSPIVYSRPSWMTTSEYPNPMSSFHATFAPPSRALGFQPVSIEMPSPFGPRHRGQLGDCPKATGQSTRRANRSATYLVRFFMGHLADAG